MESNYKVYIHKFPNNKVYIGITCQKVYKRWKNRYIGCPRMYNAIKKYGWENIEHKVLFDNLTKEEAEQKEIELIRDYKSNQKQYGYNIENGGSHRGKHNIETIEKIKKSNSSKTFFKKETIPWNKGLPMSEESKKKMIEAKTGVKLTKEHKKKISEGNKGKHRNQETIEKMINTKKEHYPNGFHHSKETIEKIRQKNLGKKRSIDAKLKQSLSMKSKYEKGYISPSKGRKAYNRKPIVQLDLENNFVREWDCISDASKYYGINPSRIILVLKGKRKKTNGYKWLYKSEYIVSNAIFN